MYVNYLQTVRYVGIHFHACKDIHDSKQVEKP